MEGSMKDLSLGAECWMSAPCSCICYKHAVPKSMIRERIRIYSRYMEYLKEKF